MNRKPMEAGRSEDRNVPIPGSYVDIGDGEGPRPMLRIPKLGPFDFDWSFEWRPGGEEAVNAVVSLAVPKVGKFTHHVHIPFSIEHQPGPVELKVTRTVIDWEDDRLGMSQFKQSEQRNQIEAELQSPEMKTWVPFLPVTAMATKRTGRRGKRPIDYALIADEYVRLLETGNTKPTKALAESLGVGRKQAENLVFRCREKGFLTPPPRKGVAGGALTDHCRQVLNEAETDE